MAKKVLVISAHPDDEILGLGGTLKRHSVNGDSVSILIVANIGTARYDKKTIKLCYKHMPTRYATIYS